MAASTTETIFIRNGGNTPGLCKLYGTVNAASVTTATIKPGNNDTNVSGSASLRKIYAYGLTNTANANAFKVVKSYSSTTDSDILTITCTSSDTFDFWVEGEDNGA